jgi:hypothetical protein
MGWSYSKAVWGERVTADPGHRCGNAKDASNIRWHGCTGQQREVVPADRIRGSAW